MNRLLNTDSYKASHWMQFPPETKSTFYYLESRGGLYGQTVFFGLQYLLKEFLTKPITQDEVSEAAAEHSTITSWGKANEQKAYENMLNQFAKPGALVAVVSDSYDLDNAVLNIWGGPLKDQVVNSGATVVIRPDSGDPETIVARTLKNLDSKFGSTYNKKGFKVLNNVRVIQGDGVNEESIRAILNRITNDGYSADNLAFGMGGALLQQVNRDTQRFAYKCSAAMVGNEVRRVFKQPATDPGKNSKAGFLDLHRTHDGKFVTVEKDFSPYDNYQSALVTVFENGVLKKETTFDEVRKRSEE